MILVGVPIVNRQKIGKFQKFCWKIIFTVRFLIEKLIFCVQLFFYDRVLTYTTQKTRFGHSTTIPHSYLDEIGQPPDFYPPSLAFLRNSVHVILEIFSLVSLCLALLRNHLIDFELFCAGLYYEHGY